MRLNFIETKKNSCVYLQSSCVKWVRLIMAAIVLRNLCNKLIRSKGFHPLSRHLSLFSVRRFDRNLSLFTLGYLICLMDHKNLWPLSLLLLFNSTAIRLGIRTYSVYPKSFTGLARIKKKVTEAAKSSVSVERFPMERSNNTLRLL